MTENIPDDQTLLEAMTFVFFQEGEDENGGPCYAYIAVNGGDLERYKTLMEKPSGASLEEMGRIAKVLKTGRGTPSDEVKQQMKDEYGFDHENMLTGES